MPQTSPMNWIFIFVIFSLFFFFLENKILCPFSFLKPVNFLLLKMKQNKF